MDNLKKIAVTNIYGLIVMLWQGFLIFFGILCIGFIAIVAIIFFLSVLISQDRAEVLDQGLDKSVVVYINQKGGLDKMAIDFITPSISYCIDTNTTFEIINTQIVPSDISNGTIELCLKDFINTAPTLAEATERHLMLGDVSPYSQ